MHVHVKTNPSSLVYGLLLLSLLLLLLLLLFTKMGEMDSSQVLLL